MNYNVLRVPLVAISGMTADSKVIMRRYVGRECTHEVHLEGVERCTRQAIMDMVELFREDPRRSLRQGENTAPIVDQPVSA
jgi:hypothetical protein